VNAYRYEYQDTHRSLSLNNITYVEFHNDASVVAVHYGAGQRVDLSVADTNAARALYDQLADAMRRGG
jgi:hypothetical protein